MLDTDAARITGSTFAFGLPDDMARMQAAAEPAALQYQQNARPGIASELAKWIALGERGDSSEALFTRLTGINVTDGASQGLARVEHPLDPSDFRRCRLMLEKCPTLLPRLQDAAGMSPQWNGLVMAWDEICRVMDDEAPGWRNPNPMRGQIATQTYDLIKQATGR